MTSTTDIDLDALQRLCDEATAGDWTYVEPGFWSTSKPDDFDICAVDELGSEPWLVAVAKAGCNGQTEANAAFIAASRTALPALIAKCREQEAEIERLKGECDHHQQATVDALVNGHGWMAAYDLIKSEISKQFPSFQYPKQKLPAPTDTASLQSQLAAANERIRELTTLLDNALGTPCEQIRNAEALHDRVTRAICQETCAFKGEMPCWQMDGQFPPSTCDEPGCAALATVALATKEPSHD